MQSRRPPLAPLPLWARWVLASIVGIAAVAGIVIAVSSAGPEGSSSEAGAEAEINRIADTAIGEDEAPHFAGLTAGVAPAAALERAIERDVRQRISEHQLTGPSQGVSCRSYGQVSDGRRSYRCTARSAGIAYPFLAVVDERRQRLAWCKVDPKPVEAAGPEIPISASCRN
jgi:hypothetical protein